MATLTAGNPVLLFLGVGFASWVLVGVALAGARRAGLLALPGPRQSHVTPTPTGGGTGMVAALVLAGAIQCWYPVFAPAWNLAVLPGLVLLCLLGWRDDRHPQSAVLRLSVHLAVSLWLLTYVSVVGTGVQIGAGWWLVGVFFMTGLMNAWNFMDGSNGMAGGQGLFSGLVLAALFAQGGRPDLALPALALAAACAGFLPWNIPRARVFMGDAGSVPIGFAVAALLLLGCLEGVFPPALALLLPAVFLVDAGMTLAVRILRGERWYTAHRQHLYQRLIRSGWSHHRVLSLYQAINLFVVLPGVSLGANHSGAAWLITGILILAMIVTWLFTSLKLGEST